MRRSFSILLFFSLLIIPDARRMVAQTTGNAPAEIRIPIAPTPVRLKGQTVLAYELHITNFLPRDLTLNRIDVFGKDANQSLAS